MAIIDELLKRAQENQQNNATQQNPFSNGEKVHETKAWRDWKGAVNVSDLETGKTRRQYYGPASEKRASKDSFGADVGQAAASAIQRQEANYKSAGATLLLGAADLLNGKKEYQPKVGSWLWRLQEGSEADTGAANKFMEDAKAGRGKVGQLVMDLTSGAVDLASDALLTAATGGATIGGKLAITAGLGAMGARSFGGGAEEAREQGKSIGQQFLTGAKSAAIEMLTEKIGGPFEKAYGTNALSKFNKGLASRLSNSAGMQFVIERLIGAGDEASEEMLSDVLNPLADKLLKLDNGEGWESLWTAEGLGQMAYDGLVGGLLGLAGGVAEGLSPGQREALIDRGIDNAIEANRNGRSIANEMEQDTDGRVASAIANSSSQETDSELPFTMGSQEAAEAKSDAPQQTTPEKAQPAVKREAGEFNAEQDEATPDNDAEPRENLEEVSRWGKNEPKPVEDTTDAEKEGKEFSPEETSEVFHGEADEERLRSLAEQEKEHDRRQAEYFEKKDAVSAPKTGADLLTEQAKAAKPAETKAEAEPAKTGADVLIEQAKAKPKTARRPKSKNVASIGDSVTAYEKGGKKSAKTVFDSTKIKNSKWAFDGKARGDEVTVNGKTYIIDRIDSGSAADVLAEAYEESTHKRAKATEYREDQKAKAEKSKADAEAKAERESKKDVEEKTRDRAAKVLGKTFGKKYETLLRTFGTKQQNQFAGRDVRAPKDVRISLKGDVLEHNTKRGDNATASVTNSAFKAKLKEIFGDKPVVITGQTVNTFSEPKYKRSEFRDEQSWLATRGEAGKLTGREFVVNSLSVDGKALTGAEYYKALEKLGLKAKSRIDVSQPRYRSANPEVYEERRGYISDRNIDINERLRYAQEMDELDFIEDVNNYIEAYFREERENGEFTGNPDAFEKQLKKHIEQYKDDHDFSWVVDGEELVRRDNKRNYTYALENDTYLDELTKEYEDVTGFNEALDSHIMRRPSYALTKEYMAKEIKAVLEDESKLETYGEEGEKLRSGTFTLMLHNVNSPYGVTVTHGIGKNPTYTIEVFHNKAKVEDGTRVRLLRQSGKSTSSLAEDVAEAIYKYEHGETYAQESVMDMTRKQMAEELTKQVPEGELGKKRNARDYSGEYTVGEFSAKVEKDYTDYWGEKVFNGFHVDFYRNGAKIGEANYKPYKGKNPDVVQKLATDFHNLNYREGEQHMFDLLKSESKEFATLQGYSEDKRELDKSRARLYNDLDLRAPDSQFEPKVVEHDGKLYEVTVGYLGNQSDTVQYFVREADSPETQKIIEDIQNIRRPLTAKTKQQRAKLIERLQKLQNNAVAEVNAKNAATPEEAVRYALGKHLFKDATSDESMKSAQKYLAQKKAKKAAERKAQNESKAEEKQSEPATGAGGAEAEAGVRGRVDGRRGSESSDDRRPNGAELRGSVRSLREVEKSETRVAQTHLEQEAAGVADQITRGRSEVRFANMGDTLSEELGLTTAQENKKGKTRGYIVLPDNIPDGAIARRGIGGHEGTHAEFINKFGENFRSAEISAWQTFKGLHPEEASRMEKYIMLKKNYVGEHVGEEYDSLPRDIKEIAADELFSHWAGGTVRTTSVNGAEDATKCQLMLQDFLVKEMGFSPNAYSRRTGRDGSASGACLISEWFTIQDEILKYSKDVQNAKGGNSTEQTAGAFAEPAEAADERPEPPKYSDVEETLNQADRENEEPIKRESLDDVAKRVKASDNKFYGERKANIAKAAESIAKSIGKDASTVLPEDLADFVGKDFSQASKDIDGFANEFLTALAAEDDGASLKTLADSLPKRVKKSKALKELLGDPENGNVAKMARVLAEAEDAKTAQNAASDLAEMIAKEAEEMPKRLKTLEQWDKNLSKRGAIARFLSGDKTVSRIASVYFGYQRDMISVLQGLDNFDKYGKGYGYELAKKILDANFKSQTALGNAIDHVLSAQSEFEKSGGANKTVELKMLKKNKWESHQISLAEAVDFLHTIRTLQASKVNAWQDITYLVGDEKLTISSAENFNRIMDALTQAVRSDKAADAYYKSFTDGYGMFKDVSKEAILGASGRTVDMYEDGSYYPLLFAKKGEAAAEHDFDFGLDSTKYTQRRVNELGGVISITDPAVRFNSYAHVAANLVARAATGAEVERLNRGGLGKSITGIVEERYGKGATDTVKQYIKDSSNFRQESNAASSLLRNLRLNIQGGALFGNFGSMLKQYPSVYNAAGILDFDSITHGVIAQMNASNRKRASEIGAIKTRHQGNLDPSVAETLTENSGFKKAMEKLKVLKFAKEGFEIVDSAAIRTIYLASEYQVEVKDNISRDSKEFNDRVMDYFIPAFLQTQPQFEKTLRPYVQTSDSELIRMFGMFKTQPLRNLNTMMRTISEYNTVKEKYGTDSKEFKATEKQLRTTLAGQASASLMFGALGVLAKLFYHRRKDLEDKDGNLDASKVMSRVLMNAAEASGGMLVFGDAAVQMAIDMASGGKTKEFYGLSAGAVSSVADALDAITTFAEKPSGYNAKRAAGYISTLFGIPLNNAYAILNSAVMYGKDIAGSNEGNYDDILKYLDAQAKAAKKEEEKAAKEAAKAAEKSGADMLADTAKKNASQSELNSQEGQKASEVGRYLTKPYTALVEAGMSPQSSKDFLGEIDTDGNNSVKQAEMIAYYKAHPEDEQYVEAMWNSYGYKTSWEKAKKKAG